MRSIKRIVTDDHVVWERNGKRFAGTKIVLDATRTPATIDVIPDGGRNRGEHILGIYKFDGDTLTICMAGSWPAPTQRVQGRKRERMHASDFQTREVCQSTVARAGVTNPLDRGL